MAPLFSIIIPVYNVAPYLRECLDSILAQKFKGWEAVCVDDGSTDGSSNILDDYATSDERFRVVHQINSGVSAARNRGIDIASGEWLYFMDADDIIVHNAFEILSDIVLKDRYDAYFLGAPIYFRDDPPVAAKVTNEIIMELPTPQSGKQLLLTGKLWGWPVIRLLRSSFFKAAKFPIGVVNLEDSLSLIDVLAVKARWCWINVCIYGYRVRPESASRFMTMDKMRAIISNFGQMYALARQRLGCTHGEALVLLKQYSSHMSEYFVRGLPVFTVSEIIQLAFAYRKMSRRIKYHMADSFVHIILCIVCLTRTKVGCKGILFIRKVYFYLLRRINGFLSCP